MPPPRRKPREAADRLAHVVPELARWMERLLAGHAPPLTLTEYVALRAIAGGTGAGADLARRAGVSPPAVSQLLRGLENDGLVDRLPEAGDRRRHALALSTRGKAVVASAQRLVTDGLERFLRDVPPPELDGLRRSLEVVESTLTGAPPPRRPPPPPHRR